MAPTRNPTKADGQTEWSLTPQQLTAVDLLATGKNLQGVADVLGVQRSTVSHWVNRHPGFQALLNQRRQELWADSVERLRGMLPKALDVLARELEGEAPLQAAIQVLRCCGVYNGIAAPTGPTDPAQIAAAQALEAEAREYAAQEAAITRKERAQTLFLRELAADPAAAIRNGGAG